MQSAKRRLKSKQRDIEYRSMNNPNPYHKFLLKNRIYCEHPGCLDTLTHATTVVNFNGRDEVRCDDHAKRLTHVRRSEQREEKELTK